MPDLLLLDFETDGLDDPRPVQCCAELWGWDNVVFDKIDGFNKFYHHPNAPEEWGAFEFHQRYGLLHRWEVSFKEELNTLEDDLCYLLAQSQSSSYPHLTCRNPNFEKSILEEHAPAALDELNRYGEDGLLRSFDTRIFDLHTGLFEEKQWLDAAYGAHHADGDVEVMSELLKQYLSMELR